MKLTEYLKNRPLIVFTFLYISVLLILKFINYFNTAPMCDPSHFASLKKVTVEGAVISDPKFTKTRTSFFLKVKSLNNNPTINGKITVNKYGKPFDVKKNDVILITGKIYVPKAPKDKNRFNYKNYLSNMGIFSVINASTVEKKGVDEPLIEKLTGRLKNKLVEIIYSHFPTRNAAIVSRMVIGINDELIEDYKKYFSDAGVVHVLVVSGLHVAYVALIFIFLFRLFGMNYRKSSLFAIPGIIAYCLITGANPPVLRATIMILCMVISTNLKRETDIYQSLSTAALFILLINPRALFGLSFQFSFTATFGIIYSYNKLSDIISRSPHLLKKFLALFIVSLSAQVFLYPLIAYYFNRISIIGIISNIAVVPITGLIIANTILVFFSSFLFPFLTGPLSATCNFLVNIILNIVKLMSSATFAVISTGNIKVLYVILYYIILFAFLNYRSVFETVRKGYLKLNLHPQ